MRVLMLGWEFPPHISGGLGTACRGLTRGLAQVGVDVTFVVPRAFGDEDKGPTRILGCNEVPEPPVLPGEMDPSISRADPAWREDSPEIEDAPSSSPPSPAPSPSAPAVAAARGPRTLAVDSALLPYLGAEEYRRRMQAWAKEAESAVVLEQAQPTAAPEAAQVAPGSPATPKVLTDADRRVSVAREPLGFTGFYGPDLLSEVSRYARVVERIARTELFDVIHAHDWMTYPAGIAASKATGKPLVVHLHASEYDRSGDGADLRIRDLEQQGFDEAARIVCVSHYTADVLRKRYRVDESKIRVVHNAVTQREQVEGWHVEKPAGDPIVLFLGRVTFQKGPVYFLEAAARVARVLPRVRFVMSGSGDMLPRMVEQAAAMGLAKNVRFTGFLSGTDVERMYAMADLYVMPSVSEPFGISPLEAMALDVPVIVSRQSGVAEVLRSALKVDFWDVADLADKIVAVLTHAALREVLTSQGREEVRGMRWEARAAHVRRIYHEVVA